MEEHILHGVPELYQIPNESFGHHIYKALLKGGKKTAMVCAVTGEEISYSEIRVKTLTFAQYMRDFGLRQNDVITVCGPNTLDFFIPAISALYLGITVAPISHAYVPREMVHAMNISKPKLIVCSIIVLDNVMQAIKDIPSVKKVIVYGKHPNKHGVESLADLLISKKMMKRIEMPSVSNEDVAAIMCSSGTTGLPKGVMLTHKNFLVANAHLGRTGYGQLTSDKIAIAILPFFHAYGFCMYLSNMSINMKLIVLPKFEEKLFLSSIEKYKVSFMSVVPPIVVLLAKSPLVDQYDLSSIEEIICGAAPLRKDVQDLAQKRLNVKNIRQGYGMTETTLAIVITPLGSQKVGTSGILAPSMSAKVVDPETGKSLGPYKEGELCFKGSLIMKQYCGDKQSTSATIDKDGWLHTGDIGYYDEDQFFFIVDRLKELIKFKGFQVPPAELEAILVKHPKIRDAGVIGIPDEKSGELPLAFIVKADNNITEAEIIKYVEDNVSYHKRLHGGVRFVTEIPKNPSGKILRRVLRDLLKTKSKM